MEAMPNSVRDTLMRRTSGVGKWCGGRSQQHTSTGAAPTNGSQTSTPPLAGPAPSRSAPEPLAAASAAAPEGLMHGQEEDPDGFTYMPLNLAYPGLKLVHKRPPIYVCEDFLSDEECRQLIKVGTPLLQRSKTHAVAGSQATKGRTSLTCHLAKSTHPCPQVASAPARAPARPRVVRPRARVDVPPATAPPAAARASRARATLAVRAAPPAGGCAQSPDAPLSHAVPPAPAAQLLHKIQLLTHKPFSHMELPQVARYTDSQRYVEHYDGVDPHTPAGKAFVASGGQRVATVLMYLNDVDVGGGTSFRRINVEIKPRKGHAVIFFPAFMNGELDPDALHAGMPPTGVKWVSQVWIRQSQRADGQPSVAVPIEEQTLIGPLHEGVYVGRGAPEGAIGSATMTFDEAKEAAKAEPRCEGFTFECDERYPAYPVPVTFLSTLVVAQHIVGNWTYALGRNM